MPWNINLEECEDSALDNASFFGRIFARSGGVSEAVKQVVEHEKIDIEFKPVAADGLDACAKYSDLQRQENLMLTLLKVWHVNADVSEERHHFPMVLRT